MFSREYKGKSGEFRDASLGKRDNFSTINSNHLTVTIRVKIFQTNFRVIIRQFGSPQFVNFFLSL